MLMHGAARGQCCQHRRGGIAAGAASVGLAEPSRDTFNRSHQPLPRSGDSPCRSARYLPPG